MYREKALKFRQILSISSQDIERKRNSDVNQGPYSVKILRKMTANTPKLDFVNVDVHTKFGQILSIGSRDIERKRNSYVNQGLLLRQTFAKNDGQQSQARSCQC